MNDFIEKWKNDKKYQTKVKLLLYTIFVVIVAIYAFSIDSGAPNINLDSYNDIKSLLENKSDENNDSQSDEKILNIPEKYTYTINIVIDDDTYRYSGEKTSNRKTIIKEVEDTVTTYLYQDNEYFVEDNGIYLKTTKDEVYDVISYNYINLDNINTYLNKAKKDSNQYIVYLKDIILGTENNDYFVILVSGSHINIDYTPLMKQFNNSIEKYKVDIQLEEIE